MRRKRRRKTSWWQRLFSGGSQAKSSQSEVAGTSQPIVEEEDFSPQPSARGVLVTRSNRRPEDIRDAKPLPPAAPASAASPAPADPGIKAEDIRDARRLDPRPEIDYSSFSISLKPEQDEPREKKNEKPHSVPATPRDGESPRQPEQRKSAEEDARKDSPTKEAPKSKRRLRILAPSNLPPQEEKPVYLPYLHYRVPEWLMAYWRKVGGGSLVASLVIHLVLLIIASFIVTSVVSKPRIDFLSGGGSKAGEEASAQLAQRVKSKKRLLLSKVVPLRKVATNNSTSAIALPDITTQTIDLPQMSSILGGTMGSSGFGTSGAGGGFGKGMGLGGMSGSAFKPIVMFGKNLNARSIAVILDVSGSMTPHLSSVIEELDRVARGSPVVLYTGCGIAKPPFGVKLDDEATETRRTAQFRTFWLEQHGPEKDVFRLFERRRFTYFVKSQGIQYAWISLLTDQVRHAEALYWFSDFQDEVDDEQIESVLTNLKRRKQKLFIHASEMGSSFEKVRDKLCLPSGGMVIQGDR